MKEQGEVSVDEVSEKEKIDEEVNTEDADSENTY